MEASCNPDPSAMAFIPLVARCTLRSLPTRQHSLCCTVSAGGGETFRGGPCCSALPASFGSRPSCSQSNSGRGGGNIRTRCTAENSILGTGCAVLAHRSDRPGLAGAGTRHGPKSTYSNGFKPGRSGHGKVLPHSWTGATGKPTSVSSHLAVAEIATGIAVPEPVIRELRRNGHRPPRAVSRPSVQASSHTSAMVSK